VKRPVAFSPAPALLSRAWWYLCDHPGAVALGLGGSAPAAAAMLLYAHEATDQVLVHGSTAEAMRPLAFGLAALCLARFPPRLALARWMADRALGTASIPRALGFALVHLPAALLYGAASTLGWILGAALAVPMAATFGAAFALHRFAAGEDGAWATLSAAVRAPVHAAGFRLLTACTALWLVVFLVAYTSGPAALDLAEWLLSADVAALGAVIGHDSPAWIAACAVLALTVAELLWFVAFGLLAAEWGDATTGADIAQGLARIESAELARAEAS
jgi:hypothetical protein